MTAVSSEYPNVGPGAVRVELVFKALRDPESNGFLRKIVTWPEGWRLPQVGESVGAGEGRGGFVQYVEWDLANGVVRVALR